MSSKSQRKKIIIAVDESNDANFVMASASEAAENISADVIVVSVVEFPSFVSEGELDRAQIEAEEKRIAEYHKTLITTHFSGSTLLIESRILHGDPAQKICEYAEKIKAHIVVIGSSNRGKIQSKLLGSVSESVIKNCPCSVLTVKK